MTKSSGSFDNSLEKGQSADEIKKEELNKYPSESELLHDDKYYLEKSFCVRKEEIIIGQIDSHWYRAFYYLTIFIGMYVSLMQDSVIDVFISYATNDYKQHSLLSTIGIVRSVIAAASLPAYARLSDTFGRTQLYVTAILLQIIGIIIQSQATSVEKYAGGIVFYGAGFAGTRILYQINLQDASSLRYRLMTIAILNLPSIITTWSSGEVVNSLLNRYSWKFGIAMWAFTLPLCCAPYFFTRVHLEWKASKTDAYQTICVEEKASFKEMNEATKKHEEEIENGGNKFFGWIKIYSIRFGYRAYETFWRVDIMGCFLIVLVLGCILVPLTLAGGVSKKWNRASTIVPLVIGFCLVPVFVMWENRWAKRPLIPFPLLKDRGIWAAFIVGILYTFASAMPNSYSYPVLLVGMNASVVVATRTRLLNGFVTALGLPVVGWLVSRVRRTKGFILLGVCIWFVAMGLFVHFRGDNDGLDGKYYRNGLAAGMCVLGLGTALLSRLVSVSAQTCTNHEYMASVTAMFAALYQIGSALGRCVTGAMWTQEMYQTITRKMTELGVDPSLAKPAYASPYKFIEKYTWGTPARVAVVLAYAEIQRKLCIVGLCLCVPLLVFSMCLRDHYLVSAISLEHEGDETVDKKESTIVFTKDDDPIFRFFRKIVGKK